MRLLSNMRIWQKAILPLVILGLACGGITFFMSGRISSIDTAYSALIDNDATAAIQASRADTNTSDLWALAYQTIAESDVPKMQDLIKQMEAKRGEYEEHLAKIGKALGNDPEIETQLKGLDAKFTKAQQSAIQAGTLSLKNTTEANAAAAYKQMITASGAEDIVYSNLFTGVHGNYLKPSIVAAGMDPDNLPQSDPSKMSFGTDESGERAKPKAWKEIWGSGQGIGSISTVVPAAELVARFKREYDEANDPPL